MATTISTDSPKLTADVASRAELYGGRGLIFDGVVDYLNCGSSSSLDDIWSGGGTLSAWIYPHSVGEGGFGMIANKRAGGNVGWIFHLNDLSSGVCDLRFYQYRATTAGDWITTSREVTINAWNHIVITFDSDSTSNNPLMYVNGTLVALTQTGSQSGAITSDASGEAGAYTFNGSISDVKVYSSALTEAEIQSQYLKPESVPSPSTLVAWYPMSEGLAQSIAYDHSGNNNHAVEGGGSSYTLAVAQNEPTIPQIPLVKYNEKMVFDGVNDYVETTTNNDIFPDGANYSISCWVSLTNYNSADSHLFVIPSELKIKSDTSGNIIIYADGSSSNNIITNAILTDSDFHHLVIIYDGSLSGNTNRIKCYVDGVLIGTSSNSGTIPSTLGSTSKKLRIGADNVWMSGATKGVIDEFSIFATSFSATQVQELFNDGVAYDATTHSKSGNLLGYWRNDGVTTWQDRRGWSALDFDGVNDHVEFPISGTYTQFTFSGWFNADVFENTNIWEWGTSQSERLGIWTWANDFHVKLKDQTLITSAHGLSTGTWFHLATTYDGSTLTLYLNGSSFATASHSNVSSSPSGNLRIGGDTSAGNSYRWDGKVAQFSFYSTSLTSAQVLTQYNNGINSDLSSDANLVGYWKLDNATTVKDLSGNGNDGTVTEATLNTGNTGNVQGSPDAITIREGLNSGKDGLGFPLKNPSGNVLRLNGIDEHLKLPYTKAFNMGSGSFTVTAWIKTTLGVGDSIQTILWARDNDDSFKGFEFQVDDSADRPRFILSDGTGTECNGSNNTVESNKWHFVAVVVDKDNDLAKIFLSESDGSALKCQTTTDISARGNINATPDWYIGKRNGATTQDFMGIVDELMVYNVALTAFEADGTTVEATDVVTSGELLKNYKFSKGKHKND